MKCQYYTHEFHTKTTSREKRSLMYGQTFNIFQSALASAETRNNMTQFGLWRLIHSKRLIFQQLLIC